MFGHSYFPAGYYGSGFYGPTAAFHVLAGSNLATSGPAISAPALVRGIVFPTASDLAVAVPAISTATFVQKFLFGAVGATAGLPTFTASVLGQKHSLIKIDLTTSAPTFSTPQLNISNILTPSSTLVVPVPVFGTTTLGQAHTLIATRTPIGPVLGAGTFAQKQVFVASDILVPAPAISVAGFGAGRALVAPSFATSPAALATGVLTQLHVLVANGITVAFPALGVPTPPLTTRVLTTGDLIMPVPIIGLSTLGITDVLTAINLVVHAPVFGLPPEAETIGAPLVWLHNRLKRWSNDPHAPYYDDDGSQDEGPVQEAIFSNLNDDIEFEISALTLVGRTSPERGPAELIEAVLPLFLWNRKLWIDIAQLAEDLAGLEAFTTLPRLDGVAADLNTLNDSIMALQHRVTALETAPRSYVDRGGVELIAPLNDFIHQVTEDAGVVILNPAGNLARGTFKLPTAPTGRQKIDFIAVKSVNNLTFLTDNVAHTLANPPSGVTGGKCITAVFGPTFSTWLFFA